MLKEKVQAGDVITIDKATGKITKLGESPLSLSRVARQYWGHEKCTYCTALHCTALMSAGFNYL